MGFELFALFVYFLVLSHDHSYNFRGKLASSIPHSVDSRSPVQKQLAEEFLQIFNALVSRMDSEEGVDQLGDLLEDEDVFCGFLELVAPLIRANYDACTNLMESKIVFWIPQYEVILT